MGVSETLSQKYKAYQKEEEILEENIVSQFKMKAKWLTSGLFIAHLVVLVRLFIYIGTVIIKVETGDRAGSAIYFTFVGLGLLCWIIFGLIYWFNGGDCSDAWVKSIAKMCASGYERKRAIKKLKDNKNKREEFFTFYELYQSDETFRDSYNAQFASKKEEAENFLKRMN